ncbi:MAG: UvrB/UvrC motif-containing protein, partial [Marinomonas sp.]
QTIGRAARNVNGKAILYADRITGSMERAISETDRRREKQIAHNKEHGITPKGITKSVEDIMEGAYNPGAGKRGNKTKKVAETAKDYQVESMEDVAQVRKAMVQLQKEMMLASEELKFELAAGYRDQIRQLQKKLKDVGES